MIEWNNVLLKDDICTVQGISVYNFILQKYFSAQAESTLYSQYKTFLQIRIGEFKRVFGMA